MKTFEPPKFEANVHLHGWRTDAVWCGRLNLRNDDGGVR